MTLRFLLMCSALAALIGCKPDLPAVVPFSLMDEAAETAEREAVVDAISKMNRDGMDASMKRLADMQYSQVATTLRLNSDDTILASRTRRETVTGLADNRIRTLVAEDSTGNRTSGLLDRFASRSNLETDSVGVARIMLPDSPDFLVARNYEQFVYRTLKDTMIAGRATERYAFFAHPEMGKKQPTRSTRLYIDKQSRQLVGIDVHRINFALMFREVSHLRLMTTFVEGTTQVPMLYVADSEIGSSEARSERFRREITFSEIRPS